MPRYSGYDPQDFMGSGGGNPWYNPYQAGPDIAAGIRDTLNKMWGLREYRRQQDEDRRRWEAKQALEAQQSAANVKRDEAYAKYYSDRAVPDITPTPAPVDRVGLKTLMRGMGVPQEQVDTIDALSDADLSKVKDKIIGRYGQQPKQPAQAKPVKDTRAEELASQIKADRKLLDTSIATIGKAKSTVFAYKDMDPQQKQAAMDGLTAAIGRIGGYRKLMANGQPLPQGIRDTVNGLAGDPTGLITGNLSAVTGEGGPAPAPQATPPQAPPQPSALPPEVKSYMQNHPGANLAAVLQKYQEWIKKQGKK